MVPDPWASRLIDEGQGGGPRGSPHGRRGGAWLGGPTVHAALFVSADTKLGRAELSRWRARCSGRSRGSRAATPEELAAVLPAAVVGTREDFALRLRGARGIYLADGR